MKALIRTLSLLVIFPLLFIFSCRKENIFRKITPEDFLSGGAYTKLVVEIQYVNGYAPSQATLDNLHAFLEKRLNKPQGIIFTQTPIASPGRSYYSHADINSIERKNRTEYAGKKNLAAYVLFLDGEYQSNNGNAKVLGVAFDKTSICIFEKTIKDYSGGMFQPPSSILETTVIEHEFGHLFGLVNFGSPMQTHHQDGANGYHCNAKNCLMYYAAETTDILANLTGGTVPELDANCIADLRANGGK